MPLPNPGSTTNSTCAVRCPRGRVQGDGISADHARPERAIVVRHANSAMPVSTARYVGTWLPEMALFDRLGLAARAPGYRVTFTLPNTVLARAKLTNFMPHDHHCRRLPRFVTLCRPALRRGATSLGSTTAGKSTHWSRYEAVPRAKLRRRKSSTTRLNSPGASQ